MLRPNNDRGFSLTETVIALGLFAFCILPIIGLMPVGMGAARCVAQEAQAVNLAEAYFGAWQVRPTDSNITYFSIPVMFPDKPSPFSQSNAVTLKSTPKAQVMYFDGSGAQVVSDGAGGVPPGAAMKLEYDVNTDKDRPLPDGTVVKGKVTIKLDFSWPPNGGVAVQKRSFIRVLPGSYNLSK